MGYFKRQHSLYLCNNFTIDINGIDYYNKYNVGFEFKETWATKQKDKFFKIPLHQAKIAKYFVFCENLSNFYIVESKEILNNYDFNTKTKKAFIRLNSVIKMAIFHTKKIETLKEIIEMIQE